MTATKKPNFVPVLTVMAEYGNAPFLWLVDSPEEGGVGGNICDGYHWDESHPMSEGLWRKFADWAIEFDRTSFYSDNFDADGWDWIAFNARGLQLSSWLKEEVGDAYRVFYHKPHEDPNHCINERAEVFINAEHVPLTVRRGTLPIPLHFTQHILSSGQTGADRGALDFAIKHGYTHGGWAPCGRAVEDGFIPLKYQLAEMTAGDYRQSVRRNVADSDGTLIVNSGELDAEILAIRAFAEGMGKPHIVVQIDCGVLPDAPASIVAWLRANAIKTLNVTGPSEGKCPGIYQRVSDLLEAVDNSLHPASES